MRNLIRADIYRILRGKGIYIIFAVILAVIILGVTVNVAMVNIVTEDGVSAPLGIEVYGGADGFVSAAGVLFSSMEQLVFILLALVLVVVEPIFSNGTVKNDIARGISRTKLYLSKLFICCVLSVLMYLIYIGGGMLLYVIINGFGTNPVPTDFWITFLQAIGAQLLIFFAIANFALFLIFTTKREGVVIGIFIAFLLVPTMVLNLITVFWDADLALMFANFDLTSSLGRLGFLNQLETHEILTVLGIGVSYILVSLTLGLTSFRKAEIK